MSKKYPSLIVRITDCTCFGNLGYAVRHMTAVHPPTATLALEHARGEIREAGPDIRDEGPPQQDVETGVEDLVETGQADSRDVEERVRPSAHQRPNDVHLTQTL